MVANVSTFWALDYAHRNNVFDFNIAGSPFLRQTDRDAELGGGDEVKRDLPQGRKQGTHGCGHCQLQSHGG